MRNAGKYAMKFIKNLDMASTLDDDLLYMIYLLKAIGEKETIKKELRDAYETLEDTCFESKYSAIFGCTMIEDIIWYIDITERDIFFLKYPKLGLWHLRGVIDEELDQIKTEAEEVQVTENEYMEEESWQAIRELFENAEANTDAMLEYQEKDLGHWGTGAGSQKIIQRC